MNRLAEKVVVLTGASRGIGPVIANALAAKGAHLVLAARSRSGLTETKKVVSKHGIKAVIVPVDLRQAAARKRLIDTALKTFGRIDILVNDAGLESEGAYEELSWKQIRDTIEVNLVAPMELVHLVLPQMMKQGSGCVVNIASVAGKNGIAYGATYSGTKAGLAEWTKALRLEYQGTVIGFSTIFPGFIRELGMFAKFGMKTPFLVGSCSPQQVAAAVISAIETGRKERIVNSMPLRYIFMLSEMSPRLGDWLNKVGGPVALQKRKVGK